MEHKGVAYEIIQAAHPSWKWIIHFNDGRLKTGIESSRGKAVFKAVRTIDDESASTAEAG